MRRRPEAFRAQPLATSERDVVALVAHELKNPLSALELALPLMAGAHPASRQKARRVIERQVVLLRRLVNDLLDAERARRGDLQVEKRCVDLRAIVGEVASTFTRIAHERGVTVLQTMPFAPVPVMGDGVRLQQVISNLLENAVKHTNAGGTIRVGLKATTDQAVVSVSDTGDGIPSGVLPQIFEPFRHYGRNGGLGIGLNVARRLVELHGGDIRAQSAGVGRGAEFIVTLPLAAGARRRADRFRH